MAVVNGWTTSLTLEMIETLTTLTFRSTAKLRELEDIILTRNSIPGRVKQLEEGIRDMRDNAIPPESIEQLSGRIDDMRTHIDNVIREHTKLASSLTPPQPPLLEQIDTIKTNLEELTS